MKIKKTSWAYRVQALTAVLVPLFFMGCASKMVGTGTWDKTFSKSDQVI